MVLVVLVPLCVSMEGLACKCKVRLAHGLVLSRVSVDQVGDILRMSLPVHDELGLADLLADT